MLVLYILYILGIQYIYIYIYTYLCKENTHIAGMEHSCRYALSMYIYIYMCICVRKTLTENINGMEHSICYLYTIYINIYICVRKTLTERNTAAAPIIGAIIERFNGILMAAIMQIASAPNWEIFSKLGSIKPKSDCIYRFPVDLEHFITF